MKILKVIHGYPMRYNAGSEVYTQGLAQALAERHEVHVFARQENAFLPEYGVQTEKDSADPRIALHIVNMARAGDGYRHIVVDRAFEDVLGEICPDIVHIGHLNHLSTSLVFSAKEHKIPIVFTLHDYWLMCPRGQFIQRYPEDLSDVWSVCDGQDDRKCAVRCYARYFSGSEDEYEQDAAHWTDWVGRRMAHVREVCDAVDMFIAPSRYLLNRFRDEFGIPEQKLTYLDYGFHLDRLECRSRVAGEAFTFGYIGTHIPAKGVNQLIESFGHLNGDAKLRIWGRDRGMETQGLKALASSLPNSADSRIEWMGEYRNQNIVPDVFNRWRRNCGPLHLGGELPARHPRGAPGQGAGDHCRLRRDGRICPSRAQRPTVRPTGTPGRWQNRCRDLQMTLNLPDSWDREVICSRMTGTSLTWRITLLP